MPPSDIYDDVRPAPAAQPSDIVGQRIKELRRRIGWTAQQLGDRLTEAGLGKKITAATISNMETGRRVNGRRQRHLTIEEVVALAYVFGVGPGELLVSPMFEEPYEIVPGKSVPMHLVRAWLDMDVALDDVVLVWERMTRDDSDFAHEIRRVWFNEQSAHQERVTLVIRVRAEAAAERSDDERS